MKKLRKLRKLRNELRRSYRDDAQGRAPAGDITVTYGTTITYGDAAARDLANRLSPVADIAALKALTGSSLGDGDVRTVTSNRSTWQFVAGSTLVDTTNTLIAPATDATGAWLRCDRIAHLRAAIAYTTADAAALFTVPVGWTVEVVDPYWEITTGFTGGTSSAIGVSSDLTGYNTKGDILGGASGQLTAAIGTAGKALKGTAGAITASRFVLTSGKILRFDRIASVYTAGAGFVNAKLFVLDALSHS